MPQTHLDLEHQIIELTEIIDISRVIHESLDPETVAQTLVDRIFRMASVNAVALYHGWANQPYQVMAYTPEIEENRPENLPVEYATSFDHVLQTGYKERLVTTGYSINRIVWLVPLNTPIRPVGILAIWERDQSALTDSEHHIIEKVSDHAALALHNALTYAETDATLSERVIELSTIEVVSRRISAILDRDAIIGDVLAAVVSAINAEVGSCLLRGANDDFDLVERYDTPTTQINWDEIKRTPGSLIEQVISTRQAVLIADAQEEDTAPSLTPGMRSLLCVPILDDDAPVGVLLFEDSVPNAYTRTHLQLVTTLVEHTAVAIKNARLYEEIRAGRDQLQAILDSTRDAVLLFDSRGRLLRYNPAAETMLGQSLNDYLSESFTHWLRHVRAHRLQETVGLSLVQFRQHVLDILHNPSEVKQRQFQQIRGETIHHIDETGSPVIDDEGQIVGWLVVWRDSTEERRLDMMRRELSSMVVHDLRNPITSIISGMGMLQDLMADGSTNPAVITEVIQIAQNSAENMLNLVQSLLDVSRLEQSSVSLDCESLSLLDPIHEAMKSVLGLALSAGITIVADIPDELPPVWIDDEKIQRVMINLLDNALRHTPREGRITVEAIHRPEERAILVRVDDTGPGIPPEARSRIFDKFVQLDQVALRGHKGTGLGLTFCKLAVEAHGGRIWVEEGDNGGAAFCFTVPVAFAHGIWSNYTS